MEQYVYVLDKKGRPLMPTKRYGHVRRLLRSNKAVAVNNKPFTIRLKYEPETHVTQDVVVGVDPGRSNIGISAVREDGTCVMNIKCTTRNKKIPKLMEARKAHRHASRRGERLARKRLAKKLGTTIKGLLERKLPGYHDGVVQVKDIINTEARFNNRKRPKGWLTPTARQLLLTHINLIRKVQKFLPVTKITVELNRFAFMQLDNPEIQKWQYQKGPLYQKGSVKEAVYEQQNGKCLFCGERDIEEYHHIIPRSKNGSDTLENRAGLCKICHELVQNNVQADAKLKTLKSGMNKKYGALSVLNQIIPYLIQELGQMFPHKVYVTTGYSTCQFREAHQIPKDHDLDAYCIAGSILEDQKVFYAEHGYEIMQFRRHDRTIIKAQTERTYKLDDKVIARNRRKRMDQKEDSLHEWYIKTKQAVGAKQAHELQKRVTVKKSSRRYNDTNRLLPGVEFLYKKNRYIMSGQLSKGRYFKAVGDSETNYPVRDCVIIAKNQGLVFI